MYPLLSGRLPYITSSILLILIFITTILARLDKFSGRWLVLAGIFLITGIFSSLSHSIASGIPEYESGFISSAAADAVGTLRCFLTGKEYCR